MLLNNYYNAVWYAFTNASINFVNIYGTAFPIITGDIKLTNNAWYTGPVDDDKVGILFGDGNIAPTPSDHTLSGSRVAVTGSAAVTSKKGEISCLCTVTNSNSSEVTIREVATVVRLGSYSNANGLAMIDRTVLDSPVTIPAAGVGVITYTIRMNYPTA